LTELQLEGEFVSHRDSLARRPIDPATGNSFGSYSEPGTRNNYQAEVSPMVRDDDDCGGVTAREVTKTEID